MPFFNEDLKFIFVAIELSLLLMKIICIGRNYAAHAKELNNAIPTEAPVIFMKPATAALKDNKPFYHPDFSEDIHHEAEIILRIGKNGKYVGEKFAKEYISDISVGLDFTARDLQQQQKEKGLPWEIAKAFDNSAVIGTWKPVSEFQDFKNIHFHLLKNKEQVQTGHTADLLFTFEQIIVYVSQFFTLSQGDIIFTGTPAGVSKINIGDQLEAFLEGESVLSCEVK